MTTRFAIMGRYIVTANEDGSVPFGSKVAATLSDGDHVASTLSLVSQANAAADLLAAAKRALNTFKAQGESVRPGNVLGALEAAIAKATKP